MTASRSSPSAANGVVWIETSADSCVVGNSEAIRVFTLTYSRLIEEVAARSVAIAGSNS